MLIDTVLTFINHENFSFEYLKNIEENQLAEIIKPLGFQNKQANDFNKAIGQISDLFGGKIPGMEKELWNINGIGQKIVY